MKGLFWMKKEETREIKINLNALKAFLSDFSNVSFRNRIMKFPFWQETARLWLNPRAVQANKIIPKSVTASFFTIIDFQFANFY